MEEKKDKIIECAQKLISYFGIKKTTIDDIAKKCNMGKSSIYYYFKNKDEIIHEVMKKENSILIEKIKDELKSKNNPVDKINGYIIARSQYIKERSDYYKNVKSDYFQYFSLLMEEKNNYKENEVKIVSQILEEGVKEGIFKINNIDVTANLIVLSLLGLDFPLLIDKNNKMFKIRDSYNELINILVNGIMKG